MRFGTDATTFEFWHREVVGDFGFFQQLRHGKTSKFSHSTENLIYTSLCYFSILRRMAYSAFT